MNAIQDSITLHVPSYSTTTDDLIALLAFALSRLSPPALRCAAAALMFLRDWLGAAGTIPVRSFPTSGNENRHPQPPGEDWVVGTWQAHGRGQVGYCVTSLLAAMEVCRVLQTQAAQEGADEGGTGDDISVPTANDEEKGQGKGDGLVALSLGPDAS